MTTTFSKKLILNALVQSFKKLNPLALLHNPVMFITEIGALITTIEWLFLTTEHSSFYAQVSIWLWLTVLFANYAESVAEARNQAQAESLRRGRVETTANLRHKDGTYRVVSWKDLKKG